MRIGITCYPTYGGSGVVATELGKKLAALGHKVHFVSYALPYRLNSFNPNLFFHEVDVVKYPLFEYPPYSLSLASKMVEVIEYEKLDIMHVHYAIPHATSAYLAREISHQKNLKVITTLHGTDITLIGQHPSFRSVVRFSIEQSDGITAVSEFLREETCRTFDIQKEIKVIPNFVPDDFLGPHHTEQVKSCFKIEDEFIITHISNFRPLKRTQDIIEMMRHLVKKHTVKLLMVGDGPDRSVVEARCHELGLCGQILFLGKQDNVADILCASDVFLLPSEHESFGLAALEAMACGVPCVTSNAGGLTDLNKHGKTGFVAPVGDIAAFVKAIERLIEDGDLRKSMGENARRYALNNFSADAIVQQFLNFYEEVLAR
ncbi:MAG TPA: N-acetyl-alpha-D-glucosaminyl L-malate synthase BshA [Caldithrix abyssi]|uniref:N-acetyl-alpha-D-glucosaminyl L-malate synthase BshA n=1 Tax=Caldithrix abyssi TaxID=187145 RepID=A0A7V4TYC6_CALAY|nr:N-acetyl-alpha-D-glucosaminyl L-malate synthase BshA [Caldithrix abyssi]